MKRLIILGAVWAVTVAKPELYKEKEDFQFSRSSSDDGTKSGFYGAQRGNMGGNYERAHNMDSLAQNQMSGLVRQVDGELGDGAKMRTGSVYTAANSRGTYGSGHYDLGNLAGRNFQESYDGSHSGSSHSSSQLSSSAYNAQHAGYANSRSQSSIHSGYQTAGHSGLNQQSDDLQSLDNLQGTGQYAYGRHSSHSTGYNAQSGYQQQSAFDSSNTAAHNGDYGSNVQTRLISTTPVRIIVRPGTRVAIPLAAQSYDIAHRSTLVDQNSLASDAEVLGNDNQRTVHRPSNAKHYESSYNYRKEWEKHDTIPFTVTTPATPTDNPFPRNSELYEDSQAHTASDQFDARRVDSQRVHSSNIYGGYANNAHVKSASSQTRSNYDTQHGALLHTNSYTGSGYNGYKASNQQGALDSNGFDLARHNAGSSYHGAAADSNSLTQAAYNTGLNADLNSQVEDLNSKPKSYQSSYSYHKSWERQGDPYVIKPASSGSYDGQSSRLTSSTKNQGYGATGSHYQHSHQSEADCDENGHIRMARSYNTNQFQEQQQQSQNLEDLGQQVEDLGQQVEDLGQQTQSQWGQQDLGQQTQNAWDNLEDLNQQSQNNWDKFEDLRQKPENDWAPKVKDTTQIENLEQNAQNLEQQKQQTTNEWRAPDNFGHQNNTDLTKLRHDEEHVYRRNQDNNYEQSNKFNEQEQSELIKNDQISIWDKVNNFGSYQSAIQKVQNESKNENPNSSEQFNWNSFSQNEGLLQPQNLGSNITIHNVNKTSDGQHFWDQSTQQTDKIPYFNLAYYNNQNQSSKQEEHSLQETHKFNESYNWNTYSSSQRQEQTTRTRDYSHYTFETIPSNTAPLSSLWSKLDSIEQQSTLAAGLGNKNIDEEKYSSQMYNNNNSQGSYQNTRQDQANQTPFTPQYNNNRTIPYHYGNEDIKENKTNVIKTDKERPQDSGRGDIGPEDLSDSIEDKEPARYPFEIPTHENKTIGIEKDLQSHQKSQDQISQGEIEKIGTNINDTNHNINHTRNLDQQNLNAFGQNEYLQKISHNFGQEDYLEQQKFQNVEQNQNDEQQSSQYFGQQIMQDFGQQNLQDFGQQNMQDFGQQDYLEQQNVQNVGMNNLHNFEQQNTEQQNLQDFGQQETVQQQNLQVFGQNDEVHQNLFEQQNMHDFGPHDSLEQQNVQNFAQQNLQDLVQQGKREQQNLQDFEHRQDHGQQMQQDFVKPEDTNQQKLVPFGQNANLEQQNKQDLGQEENFEQINLQDGQQSMQDFGQQNMQDFEQHDFLEKLSSQNSGQQHLHDFRKYNPESRDETLDQHNDFGPQSENLDQQNLNNLGKLNQNLKEDDLKPLSKPEQQKAYQQNNFESQNLPLPKEIEEPIQVQKQHKDLQSNSPESPNTVVVLPIEPVTEKPGFWKSVGNKFSTAKSKIASWF